MYNASPAPQIVAGELRKEALSRLHPLRTPTNRRVYTDEHLYQILPQRQGGTRATVVYMRVSSQAQRPDLANQRTMLEQFCAARGITVTTWVSEIGGGLNFRRPKFLTLIDQLVANQLAMVVMAHQDRLMRFGFDLYAHLCRRHNCEWVMEVHKDANQQPFTHLRTAFQKFFRHEAKYPVFKKKGTHDSFYISNDKCAVNGKRLYIPRLGWVWMREALRFQGQLMSVTVSRIAERWFASIAVRLATVPPPCESQAWVGVDLGVSVLATLSTGETVTGPQPLHRLQQALRRCSRGLSRKGKGSANRAKAKRKLARIHYRMACQRKDALHKLTTSLVRRFGTVVIEDLHVKGMVRNRHLARAISDMGFRMFRHMLTYKAEAAGVTLVLADRWFPSSKLCAQCGAVCEDLSLSQRVYTCPCGFIADRDLNAALNLVNYPRLVGKSRLGTLQRWRPLLGGRETAVGEPGTTERTPLGMF